jgi:hypothetical protein
MSMAVDRRSNIHRNGCGDAADSGIPDKEVAALLVARSQYGLETPGHRLLEPLALFMIGAGAGARLEGFAFSAGSGAPAVACLSRSRTITRIHSGSVDRPLRKSL